MDQLPRLGKRELICLLLFTCNYVVSVWRGFLFLWVLGMGYVILLWYSLSLPYNYFSKELITHKMCNDNLFNVTDCMPITKPSMLDNYVVRGTFHRGNDSGVALTALSQME